MKSTTVNVVRLNDENRPVVLEAALSSLLGDICPYCGRALATLEEAKAAVAAGVDDQGQSRIAPAFCLDAHSAALLPQQPAPSVSHRTAPLARASLAAQAAVGRHSARLRRLLQRGRASQETLKDY